ncbi:MAG: sodium-dependent transporter [Candidatus Ventricola sp.]
MKRERFQSRLGFLLVSAGCAIGIGNVWRFPYVAGQNGGGLFVLFYLVFLLVMGVPVLTMELAVGRASRKGAVQGYQALEKPGSKWHIHGWFCVAGCCLLMMYYTTVAGWMLNYFVKFLTGAFSGLDSVSISGVFGQMLQSPAEMTLFMALVVILGFTVVSFGLQKGLERISKLMMTALLLLIIVLAVNSCLLPGAGEGLKFYLLPSLSRANSQGLFSVITAAMNQAFFTLSLGIAAMEIFGSYMTRQNTLGGEAVRICLLDTFVALMSGLIIFPACFSFGVQPDAGPSLIFVTLPNIFAGMRGGRFWGTLFFLFMTFASFTTVISVFENLISNCIDMFGWNRKKAVIVNCVFILLASMPCLLGYNVLSDLHLIGGRDVLDTEDFLVSNLLLPLGSLVYLLFCTTRWGWGFDSYLAEANAGEGLKLSPKLKPFFQFVLPVLILVIFFSGLF